MKISLSMLIGFLLINRRDMQQTAKTILDNFAKFANYIFRIVLRIMFFINLIATVDLMTLVDEWHNCWKLQRNRSSHRTRSVKKYVLKNVVNFTGKHLKACNFIGLLNRCFPVKRCKIFKNTYFEEHLRTNASEGNMKTFSNFLEFNSQF